MSIATRNSPSPPYFLMVGHCKNEWLTKKNTEKMYGKKLQFLSNSENTAFIKTKIIRYSLEIDAIFTIKKKDLTFFSDCHLTC